MELVVKKRLQILLTAFNLLSLCSDIHTDTALLNLHSPRADEGDNEYNGKEGVEIRHNLYSFFNHLISTLICLIIYLITINQLALKNHLTTAGMTQKHV